MRIQSILAIMSSLALTLLVGCSGGNHDDHGHSHDHAEEAHDDHGHSHEDDDHGHAEEAKMIPGPNGGRLITSIEPQIEFLLTADRKVQLTFLESGKTPVKPSTQAITLIGGDRMNPIALSFSQQGDVLVSNKPIPDANLLPIILQIKGSPESEVVREKFHLNTSSCPSCEYQEYACICGH